jgi:acetylornithine aminotransferase
MSDHLMHLYHKLPTTFVRGEHVFLYDEQDRDYLDAITGIGVTALGHQHPVINNVIHKQVDQLLHFTNNFNNPSQNQLAEKLCSLTGLDCVGFGNSGTEVIELAIKLILKFGVDRGIKAPKIIVMEGGYHGRSLGAWSASCTPSQSKFGPLLPAFIYVPFDDINAIAALNDADIVAVMLEPIFGKGGLLPASMTYLQQLRQLCDQRGWLLLFDEIQSGLGRTGKWFAYQFANVSPDIVTIAKCLGNGIPIGACIAHQKLANTLQANDHGSTQAGNVLSCTVGLAVLNIIEQDNLLENARVVGDYLQQQLITQLQPFASFAKIRGKGLMIGIQLTREIKNAVAIGIKHGIVFNYLGKDVIRLLPPIILTQAQANILVERLVACFQEF